MLKKAVPAVFGLLFMILWGCSVDLQPPELDAAGREEIRTLVDQVSLNLYAGRNSGQVRYRMCF